MMDVYEGKFRANGGCGYLIKPAVMREHISVFSANSRETIPGVAPQLLKIKVRLGQGGRTREARRGREGGRVGIEARREEGEGGRKGGGEGDGREWGKREGGGKGGR